MIKSMTAFGAAEVRTAKGNFAVEIQCVNRKYQEIFISLPRFFTRFEPDLRKIVASQIGRGKVSVNISAELNSEKVDLVRPNIGLAKSILKSYRALARALDYKGDIDFTHILRNRDIIETVQNLDDLDVFYAPISKVTRAAMKKVMRMRLTEGKAMVADMKARLTAIRNMLTSIRKDAASSVKRCRERLLQRVREVSSEIQNNEERILREIAIYADRIDISEEITRMMSHITQFRTYLKSPEPVGRTLDFLVQEMHRETNTIGSKSSEFSIAQNVVQIKAELEKIREQVQNIE